MNPSTNGSSLIDLEQCRLLDYPPAHPLTLAREFVLLSGRQPNAIGSFASVIEGWIRDQRPAFAVKLAFECDQQDLFYSLCTFARAAAAWVEEPEPLLRSLETRMGSEGSSVIFPVSDVNDYEKCAYRGAVFPLKSFVPAKSWESATVWTVSGRDFALTASNWRDSWWAKAVLESLLTTTRMRRRMPFWRG